MPILLKSRLGYTTIHALTTILILTIMSIRTLTIMIMTIPLRMHTITIIRTQTGTIIRVVSTSAQGSFMQVHFGPEQ